MPEPYYRSTILRVGQECPEMIDGGVLILFAEPVPDALESVSVIHRPEGTPAADMRPGDRLQVGDAGVELRAVGERANDNLRDIGHVVVYLAPPEGTGLLPGAVHAGGTLGVPPAGATLTLTRP